MVPEGTGRYAGGSGRYLDGRAYIRTALDGNRTELAPPMQSACCLLISIVYLEMTRLSSPPELTKNADL